jgi:hypothetical protein
MLATFQSNLTNKAAKSPTWFQTMLEMKPFVSQKPGSEKPFVSQIFLEFSI